MQKYSHALLAAGWLMLVMTYGQASDLLQTAETSGGAKMFVQAAKTAGLTESLKNSGPYTIFVPDDSAFQKMPAAERESLMKDKEKLAKVLAYHVIPGTVKVAEVKPGNVKTLEGESIRLTSDNGKVTINDEANVTQSDVFADNGVIHVIDKVVLPHE